MRVIEEKMLNAILSGKDFHGVNTCVEKSKDGTMHVYLFGHRIAMIDMENKRLWINNQKWFSVTTRSRLNVILIHFTYKWIQQENWVWYMCSIVDKTKGKYPNNWKKEEYRHYNDEWLDFERENV